MTPVKSVIALSTLCFVASHPLTSHAQKNKLLLCGDGDPAEIVKRLNARENALLANAMLTREQKRRIAAVRAKHLSKLASLVRDVRISYLDFAYAVERNADTPEIRVRMNALAEKKEALITEAQAISAEIHAILTPEQRRAAQVDAPDSLLLKSCE